MHTSDQKLLASSRTLSRSLAVRILASLIAMLLMVSSILCLYMLDISKHIRRSLAHIQATSIAHNYNISGNIHDLPLKYEGQRLDYTLYSADGDVLYFSEHIEKPRRLRKYVIHPNPSRWMSVFSPSGITTNVPVYLDNGNILMVALNDKYGRTLTDNSLTQSLYNTSLVILLVLLLFGISLIILLLKWTLKPVSNAINIIEGITPDSPTYIPTETIPKEILPLVNATNDAMRRLIEAYQSERRFVANAAHALRTPLTVLNLHLHRLEQNGQNNLDKMKQEMTRVRTLVDQLLELANLECSQPEESRQDDVNLLRIAREAIAVHLPLFETQGRLIELTTSDKQPFTYTINPHAVMLAFNNLIENAFYHGKGNLKVIFNRHADLITIGFSDEGESPARDIQEQLFERFKKVEKNSSGSGLGLAIVRQAVNNAGGYIYFLESKQTHIEIDLVKPLVH
ncbi:hypothetical protein ACH42_11690 [Endozoicomonas sp. (ex Bugula neritina AB1)]|nr:hypothetical protein ACH42_11690 [Endozoicomonas sp. (ex Bugula neritina AB1)]